MIVAGRLSGSYGMVPGPMVPVVSCAGTARVSSALPGLAGTTGSIRVWLGTEPLWAGTRSTGTVSAGTVVSGVSGISWISLIPDATDATRPSAIAATNTITTPR